MEINKKQRRLYNILRTYLNLGEVPPDYGFKKGQIVILEDSDGEFSEVLIGGYSPKENRVYFITIDEMGVTIPLPKLKKGLSENFKTTNKNVYDFLAERFKIPRRQVEDLALKLNTNNN
ncbi:hypothetical protein J4405_01065 [Candidatus Woesearchaeota archaeon]|nr:hypothetical protein [Candidatus Woesearchaeota archaeon]